MRWGSVALTVLLGVAGPVIGGRIGANWEMDMGGVMIREASGADADAIRGIYAPIVEGTCTSFDLLPPSVEEMAGRIETTMLRYPWLVCEEDGVVGYAYGTRFRGRAAYDWVCEVSVYVSSETRGRGIGCGLYTSLLGCLDVLGYHMAYAGITLPNNASVALHESMGFDAVGVFSHAGFKHGRWCDVGWWERVLRKNADTNRSPLRPSEVTDRTAWGEAVALGISLIGG